MIVGLVGFIGAGKGTVADILVRQYGFLKESFANAVKDAIIPIFGWNREMLEGNTPESRTWREQPDPWWSEKLGKPFSPRLALQLMGTESGRNVFHRDIWILSLLRRVKSDLNYVIADVRFPNEVDMIHENNGKIIRIKRGDDPEWYEIAEAYNVMSNWNGSIQKMKKYPDIHYSEWAWIGKTMDCEINNDKTLIELERKIASALEL